MENIVIPVHNFKWKLYFFRERIAIMTLKCDLDTVFLSSLHSLGLHWDAASLPPFSLGLGSRMSQPGEQPRPQRMNGREGIQTDLIN